MGKTVREIFETMEYGPAPESADHARAWLAGHGGAFRHYIGGAWRESTGSARLVTQNPATGETLASFAGGTKEDVDLAVRAAQDAFGDWARDGYRRARFLYALARGLQRNARLFATLETLDNGKPIRETRDIDVQLVARHLYSYAGWARVMDTEFAGYKPHGVVGQVIPWNFPLLMLAWKIAPALATGNTVVLKPAEQTPLSALLFAEMCHEAGLPPGVLNVVTGDGATGNEIVRHPGVRKVAFTGSRQVGGLIREAVAGSGKELTLELGGKSPMIVFEDADIDSAVEGVVDGIWFNQGEVCCAASRLLVQESVRDKMVDKLVKRMETLRLGDPLDKCIDMGAVVSEEQHRRVTGYIQKAAAEGACVIQPGAAACPANGFFVPPTLLTDVQPSSTVAQEEVFGPVLAVMGFRTQQDAVALANNTRYGLAASVWTENVSRVGEIAPLLKAGVIWVNATNMFDASAGFGGYRESGYGREGGREGIYAYLRPESDDLLTPYDAPAAPARAAPSGLDAAQGVDKTAKMYIGGRQARPDGGYSLPIVSPEGRVLGQVGEGNRKDIRNAVAAARKAEGWAAAPAHGRAQVMYYIAENIDRRRDELARRIESMTGRDGMREVNATLRRQFYYAAMCDKYEGTVHMPPQRALVTALNEPVGVIGIVCPDEDPLLAFTSLVAPAIAMGNRVVVIPSEKHPLAATDLYQVLDTSDLPPGVVNIVTGLRAGLTRTLAAHDDVDAMWYFGPEKDMSAMVEKASTGNLKQVWTASGLRRDWHDNRQAEGETFLRKATQVKNVWIPYGDKL